MIIIISCKTSGGLRWKGAANLRFEFLMNLIGTEHGSQREFLQVIDAYMKPKCHSADSNAVHR